VTATSLRLVASAPTPALRRAVFGGDEDLDEGGLRAALALRSEPIIGDTLSSPARAAVQTARAGGREPAVEPALADCAYGRWEGRSLADVIDAEPDAVQWWLTDPSAAPHGGESFADVVARVGAWLDARAGEHRRIVGFTHATVVRAALVHALGVPIAAHRQIDVAPLSFTRLRTRSGRWSLHLAGPDR
jgi:broad specificity phosphatase PhoE